MPKYESQCSPRLASALSTLLSPSTENWLLMGEALRKQLGVTVGDSISMRGVSGDHDFLLAGTFSVGLHDYDSSFVFIDFAMAQSFFEYPGIATAIQLRLKNPDDAPKVSQEIEGEFPEIQARSWQELNGALLGTMAVERLVMRLIIILVSLLSLVGVGLLIFVILEERKKIIGVFETFGMARRQIRQLFFLEGMIISSVGIMLGVCGGLALSWLIGKIQIPLPEEIYVTYGSKVLPVAFQGSEILFILSSAAFASVFMVHLTTGRILRLKIIDLLKN
jgi:ABC-type lipoprotein release transport system permease subunit